MQAPEGEFRLTKLENVLYGPGKIMGIGRELDRRGLKRALVITGKTLGESPLIGRVKRALDFRLAGVFCGIRQHVPSKTMLAAVEEAKRIDADCLIAFGGGSPIDAAKLVQMAILTGSSTSEPIDFSRSKTVVVGPELPNFAIPTTLSAGEFTGGAGMTDEVTRHKGGRFDERLQPKVVIMDPALTLETPDWLWASTGVKALDHAVECSYSARHQLISDTLATKAIRILRAHLLAVIQRSRHRSGCPSRDVPTRCMAVDLRRDEHPPGNLARAGPSDRRALGRSARRDVVHHSAARHALHGAGGTGAFRGDC